MAKKIPGVGSEPPLNFQLNLSPQVSWYDDGTTPPAAPEAPAAPAAEAAPAEVEAAEG